MTNNNPQVITYRNDCINIYFSSIRDYKPLEEAELESLITLIQAGNDKARNRLVTANLRLVITIAKKYARNDAELEDFIEAGNMGLIQCCQHYNASRGKFSSFAGECIKHAILDYRSKFGNTIYLPENKQTLKHRIDRFEQRYEQQNGYRPGVYDIAEAFNISTTEVNQLFGCNYHARSLSETVYGDEERRELIDTLVDEDSPYADAACESCYEKAAVHTALKQLSATEQTVTRKKYGIGCMEESAASIQFSTGLSHEGVRKAGKRSVSKLRDALLSEERLQSA